MTENLSSWGKYPRVEAETLQPRTYNELSALLVDKKFTGIPRGNGRSYGDSALAPHVFSTAYFNHFLSFDETSGLLTCGAGIQLEEILTLFVSRGWFLPVTPGTQFITLGGAIASDVHGKNHHGAGCFSKHVHALRVMLANGEIVECSQAHNTELFYATCGGMGLTGIILEVSFYLKKIPSAFIQEVTLKAPNLTEALHILEGNQRSTYSVAWIDCMSEGQALGRSLIMLGEHAADLPLITPPKKNLTLPFDMPSFFLNAFGIRAFNALYYHRVRQTAREKLVPYQPYFYPLDRLLHWNRLYGRGGFTQYQCVIPKAAALEGLQAILKRISLSRKGSFLAVLKGFGPSNENYLSFPMEGYTLALDFKIESSLFPLLDELDRIVCDYGGRIYLTKDVRMSAETFRQGYPQWEKFMAIREKYGADKVFHSLQSKRLGIP